MSKQVEKVFIAWGGNQDIAKMIGTGLNQLGFRGVVGGENPSDMYIGDTVFSQIRQCTRAIILVENARMDSDNPFSSNLMLEWGYLTAKKDPSKLHVFLIGVSTRELPSDLLGIWAKEIKGSADKTREQIAKEIVDAFCDEASQPVDIDKMSIFKNWIEIKRNFSIYVNEPVYSEIEFANYLLHSIEVCYYYEEQESLLSLIEKIEPVSGELKYVIQIIKINAKLFKESSMLMKPLPSDTHFELRDFLLEEEPVFSTQDRNLSLWLKYFRYNRLCLLDMIVIESLDEEIASDFERKHDCFLRINEYSDIVLRTLKEITELYPKEEGYTKLYEGYVHRDLYRTYIVMSDIEKAKQNTETASDYYEKAGKHAREASRARRIFYQDYRDRNPGDGYLIKYFADEYYLSCIERHRFLTDIEKKENEYAIRSYYSKNESDKGRLHAVKLQFNEAYHNNFDEK
jgi:hypothetical protein